MSRKVTHMSQVTHIGLSFFGYNRSQVERVIESKDQRISELEKQVADIQAQVTKLQADMVKYQDMEQALKDGIVDARRTGNQIVQESTEEAQRLVDQTNQQVVQYKEEFAAYSHDLVEGGAQLKDQLNEMKAQMMTILSQYEAILKDTDFDALYPDKEVNRFNIQLKEYVADDGFSLKGREDLSHLLQDGSLTEEEKQELKKLIQEVMTVEPNQEAPQSNASSSSSKDKQDQEDDASSQFQAVKKVVGSDQVYEEAPVGEESSSSVSDADRKLVPFKPKHNKKKRS